MMTGQWRFYGAVSVFGIVKEGDSDERRLHGGSKSENTLTYLYEV
jgi:hypothetical protein